MDIQKFQQKLTEVCELGEKNGKVLKPEQIKECFGELDLDKSQLIKILQYLKLKGISIEGAEEISAASQTGPEEVSEEKEEKVPLTAEEEAYLKEYLEGLEEQEQGERSAEELFELLSKGDALAQAELSQRYLHAAVEMAVEMNCEEIFIADLIQEANISLLMALGEEEPDADKKQTIFASCQNDEFKINGSGTPVGVTIYKSPIPWIIRKTSECYPKDMSDLWDQTEQKLPAEMESLSNGMEVAWYRYMFRKDETNPDPESNASVNKEEPALDEVILKDKSHLIILDFGGGTDLAGLKEAVAAFEEDDKPYMGGTENSS